MSNLTNTLKISAAVGACFAFSACGAIADKVTEEGAERILEAETGENVEIDFDSDDGSLSIQTEDGSFAVDDDGNFIVTDEDGSVFTGSASDDQITVTGENGEEVLNVSGDADDGEILIQQGDGESVYRVDTSIPAEWPIEIPLPDGLTVDAGTFLAADGDVAISVTGMPSGSAVEYTDSWLSAVAASGFNETGRFDQSSDGTATAQRTYENDAWMINISGYDDGDQHVVSINLTTQP